jgi:hypothetical protein
MYMSGSDVSSEGEEARGTVGGARGMGRKKDPLDFSEILVFLLDDLQKFSKQLSSIILFSFQ